SAWTDTARGRLLSATATIFVPLPRRVGPTARPLFSRSRRLYPRTPLPDSACLAHAEAAPAASAPPPACHRAPTAGTCDGRSGAADTSPAARAIAHPGPEPTTRHSAQHWYHATGALDYRHDAAVAAPAQLRPIVRRSTPSVPSSAHSKIHRASPESHQFARADIDESGSRHSP